MATSSPHPLLGRSQLLQDLINVRSDLKVAKSSGIIPNCLSEDVIRDLEKKEEALLQALKSNPHKQHWCYSAVKRSKQADSLYIMRNTRLPDEIKIGCSHDITQRRNSLMGGQKFNIETHATFPGYGYLEHNVHNALQSMQVQDVAGTEWFRCTPAVAIKTITDLISVSPGPKDVECPPQVRASSAMMEKHAVQTPIDIDICCKRVMDELLSFGRVRTDDILEAEEIMRLIPFWGRRGSKLLV